MKIMSRNNSIHFSRTLSVFLLLGLFCISQLANAQKGYVSVRGKVRKGNSPEPEVNISLSAPGAPAQTVTSAVNGTYLFNLELQKNYTISFSKSGLVTKTIIFNTVVPADEADIIFENEFNMDLFEDVAGVSQNNSMAKPVAKIAYNPAYEDFVHDAAYTRQIQAEQLEVRKAAEELKKQQDKSRLDSLNKLWNDSLARVKDREEKLMLLRAEQEKARKDSLEKAQIRAQQLAAAAAAEKAKQDSISRAQAELARQQEIARNREKARQDSLARVQQEKVRQDSLLALRMAAEVKAKAEAEAKLKEKVRQDSLLAVAKVEAERKQREAEEKLRLELLAKQRADSLSKAEANRKIREKMVADSIAQANAALKRQQDEALKQQELLAKDRAKFVKDSTAMAEKAARDRAKFVADSAVAAKAEAEQQRIRIEADAKAREKARQDSLSIAMAVEKQKAAEQAKQKEKVRQDSLAQVENQRLLMLAETKRKDDEVKAMLAAKAKEEADARDKAAAEKQLLAIEEKARKDSAFKAQKELADKEEADRKAKAYAEIEAKKQQLSKAAELAGAPVVVNTPKAVAPVPKIVSADYHEGVTEEKVTEQNRTIYRVVVKKDGAVINYQKVVYGWGGVYFFRNEAPITQTKYEQDIKNAKASLPK